MVFIALILYSFLFSLQFQFEGESEQFQQHEKHPSLPPEAAFLSDPSAMASLADGFQHSEYGRVIDR